MKYSYLILCLLYFSCQQPSAEFKRIDKYSSFKLLELGESKSPKNGEVLFITVCIKTLEGDTLHYVPNYEYHYTLSNHYLDSIWLNFNVGDKFLLRVEQKKIKDYFSFNKVEQTHDKILELEINLINSLIPKSANQYIEKKHSEREINEQLALKNYLKDSQLSFDNKDGLYFHQSTFTDSAAITFGSEVSLHYKGSFLNGYVFDNTYEKGITPSFTYGQEYQMLKGLKNALSGLKQGEKVKLILPSRHAFWEKGSIAGIVPPYTAVIYDVNIIKVIN